MTPSRRKRVEKRVVAAAMKLGPKIADFGGYVDHTVYALAIRLRKACAALTRSRRGK